MQGILRGNLVGDQVVRVALEPEHSARFPGVLFFGEFLQLRRERIAELRRLGIGRASSFQRSKRFQTECGTRIEGAFHRDDLARFRQRIGDELRPQRFIGQLKGRHVKSDPHRSPHRVSAHHRERPSAFPGSARRMRFQIRIQRRVPIRRKRTRPVHGVVGTHFGREVVIQDFRRLARRRKLQLAVERLAGGPRGRCYLDPPFDGTVGQWDAPEFRYRLERTEHFGLVPLDGFDRIEQDSQGIVTGLGVKDFGERLPRERRAARNSGGFVFRKRFEHRERVIRKLCRGVLSRIVFRFFVFPRQANRVRGIGGKVKGGKRRFCNHAHLLVGTRKLCFEQRRRSGLRKRRRRCRGRRRVRGRAGIIGSAGAKPEQESQRINNLFHNPNI